jgi:ClpX C4-type zinc finger
MKRLPAFFARVIRPIFRHPPRQSAQKQADCSFCGQSYRAVGPLVVGRDGYICGACVELARTILDNERLRREAASRQGAAR